MRDVGAGRRPIGKTGSHLVDAFSSAVLKRLESRVKEVIADRTQRMSFGTGITEIQQYRELVGELKGLREALELLAEARDQNQEHE